MSSQISKYEKKHNETLMSQECTICQKLFQLKQYEQPNVIQIQNQYYCEACLEKRLLQEQQNIKNLEERYIYYKQYESSFNTRQYCQMSLKENKQNIEDFAQLQELQKQALGLEQLLLKTKQQCTNLKEKVVYIENEEQKFWDNINRFQKRAIKLQQKSLTAKLQRGTVKLQSDELCINSLYHEVFEITIKDNIGYISGLAMGKKPQASEIQWQEFNVGFSHLFLALNILAMKYNYSYVKFQQLYLKSILTQVLLYGKQAKCSICYSKQNEKMFGQVMQAFLIQISHFSYHLMQNLSIEYNPQVKLPYPIKQKQFKIADIFVNPNKINEKYKWLKWSEGIKYLLINFKHFITIHAIYGKD